MSQESDTAIVNYVHTFDEFNAIMQRLRALAEHWAARAQPEIRECGRTLLNRLDGTPW